MLKFRKRRWGILRLKKLPFVKKFALFYVCLDSPDEKEKKPRSVFFCDARGDSISEKDSGKEEEDYSFFFSTYAFFVPVFLPLLFFS